MRRVTLVALLFAGVIALSLFFYVRRDDGGPQELFIAPDGSTAIDRGIGFLEAAQQPTGEFYLYLCDNTQPERCTAISSGGATGGIVLLLEGVDDARLNSIRNKAISFVLDTMEYTPDGQQAAWQLFSKYDPHYGRTPPDVDDTALTSTLLLRHGVDFPRNIRSLDPYRNSAGLYLNWLSSEWNISEQDRHSFAGVSKNFFENENYFGVDCMVNADVLGYLALSGEQPEPVCSYLNTVVEKKLYPQCTFYYRSPYVFFASLTGAVKNYGASCVESSVPLIRDELLRTQQGDGSWSSNFFNDVMATRALLYTGYRGPALDRAIEHIRALQQDDGGWPNAVIFPDLVNPVFYGSRELITAAALQALWLYEKGQ